MKYCYKCGKQVFDECEICPNCGCRQPNVVNVSSTQSSDVLPSRVICAILAIFLGWVGAHKFYLGRTGQGILYLCLALFTCGVIPAIIGFCEGLTYLSMNNEAFRVKYNVKV